MRGVTDDPGTAPPTSGGDASREWVAVWREAVRVSPFALGLVELPSAQFIELSPRAAELLGATFDEETGLEYRAIVNPRKEVEQTLRLLSSSALDSIQARRRLRRADGSVVEVFMCGRAIRRTAGADLGLWVAVDAETSERHSAVTADRLAEITDRLVSLEPEVVRPVVGTLDHRWRVAQLGTDVEELLGLRPTEVIGASIIDLTHPEDTADLLLAFARATSDANASVRARLRHRRRTWQAVTAVVSVLDDAPDSDATARFAFALTADPRPDAG